MFDDGCSGLISFRGGFTERFTVSVLCVGLGWLSLLNSDFRGVLSGGFVSTFLDEFSGADVADFEPSGVAWRIGDFSGFGVVFGSAEGRDGCDV